MVARAPVEKIKIVVVHQAWRIKHSLWRGKHAAAELSRGGIGRFEGPIILASQVYRS